ncbi:DEAD-box ATP-dependent RNA helicase 31-like [Amaranthus tricolor]|uniref:DEAD-box ATP-dependent RNA helicase 31-like n=1 Tax=Amaranthus tricolor TaxID=29722 RepID=UPI0025897FA7|nr:DEAD-box ATP-dependent RNA helicase 31-like [Amaranthus tricolor]
MPVTPLQSLRCIISPVPVIRFFPMSLNSISQPSSSLPTFRRIFPFKLKYLVLNAKVKVSPRNFSTRPFRSRPDSGSRYNRTESVKAAPLSKSLIEDEDDLSDWVSGLRTSSIKSGVFTEDEDGEDDRGKMKKKGRLGKRGRESNFDFGGSDEEDKGFRQMGKKGFQTSSNSYGNVKDSSRFGRRFDGADEGNESRVRNGKREFDARGGQGEGNRGRGMRAYGDRNGRGEGSRGGGVRAFGDRIVRGEGSRGGRIGREREVGVRDGIKGKEREFGERNRGRVDGRKGALISESDEDEIEMRNEKKSVSSFLDLIGEEDSDENVDDDDEEEEELGKIVGRSRSSLFANDGEKVSSGTSSTNSGESYLSETRFDQCTVSPLSLKAIRDAGYEKMTVVQEATLPVILKGKDVMAKAKTGTGKTVAFLLPSIEVVIKTPPAGRDQTRPPILVLVICPTRELASQAASEAKTLLKYHPSIGVQVVIGGTRLAVEQKRMQANPCQILVATPGRLKDHLENTSGFATRLMGVKVLVLDEADHLLDMGFRKDIERIIAAVPKQRQTLLFSATVPDEVRQISHIALKRDHEYVNTVQEGSEETHAKVRQMHLVVPLENQFSLLYTILKEHISDDVNYKVLVFCTTAMVTRLVADLLGELNLNVREIHSRKPQNYRTRVSDEFRKSKGLILVTSDVSARGVDYPDVTLVIQLGLPSDREQYIHRLGRTGRKGKEGQGLLLLSPWEEFFLNSVKDLPITKATPPMVDPDIKKKVERALSHVEMKNKEAAYQAWLGYYNSNKIVGRDKMRLVELANEFSRSMGLDTPPAIPKLVLGKMGLKNVPGLRTK